MKRSDRRILTSHVGSLPRPEALIEINRAKFAGEAYDQKTYAARLFTAVEQICRKQAEIGIDVINDGEFGKTTRGPIDYGAWSSYAWGASAAGSPESRAASRRSPAGGTGPYLMNSTESSMRPASSPPARWVAGPRFSSARSVISAIRRWPPTSGTSRPR